MPRAADTLTAIELIRAERARQVAVEGYSVEHDDAHTDQSLLAAASVYLRHGTPQAYPLVDGKPSGWMWEAEAFKPKDRRSNLIRAGALCLAEIERRSRAGLTIVPARHRLGEVHEALRAELRKPA